MYKYSNVLLLRLQPSPILSSPVSCSVLIIHGIGYERVAKELDISRSTIESFRTLYVLFPREFIISEWHIYDHYHLTSKSEVRLGTSCDLCVVYKRSYVHTFIRILRILVMCEAHKYYFEKALIKKFLCIPTKLRLYAHIYLFVILIKLLSKTTTRTHCLGTCQ